MSALQGVVALTEVANKHCHPVGTVPMRVLIAGASGRVGSALVELLRNERRFESIAGEFDISDRGAVEAAPGGRRPDVVVNCAALADVDRCEREPVDAVLANAVGVRVLGAAAARWNAALVHLSTDYVFDGESAAPYEEVATPSPINRYGLSKWWGEQEAARAVERHYIVRTSWLYADAGSDFAHKILDAARRPGELHVVEDQFGSPTYARDLAVGIAELLGSPCVLDRGWAGVFHVTNRGTTSRLDQARRILAAAGLRVALRGVPTVADGRAARRPLRSVLASSRWEAAGLTPLRAWESAQDECVARILAAEAAAVAGAAGG